MGNVESGTGRTASSAAYESLVDAFNASGKYASNECRILLVRLRGHLVLRIEGKAQQRDFRDFATEVRPILATRRLKGLIVDLSMCESIASPAIGLVAFVMMEANRSGATIHLIRAKETVMRSLNVMGLSGIYKSHDSIDDVVGE